MGDWGAGPSAPHSACSRGLGLGSQIGGLWSWPCERSSLQLRWVPIARSALGAPNTTRPCSGRSDCETALGWGGVSLGSASAGGWVLRTSFLLGAPAADGPSCVGLPSPASCSAPQVGQGCCPTPVMGTLRSGGLQDSWDSPVSPHLGTSRDVQPSLGQVSSCEWGWEV